MDEKDLWRVADLLDYENEPFAEDVKLARQMLSTYRELQSLDSGSVGFTPSGTSWSPEIRVPRQAIKFMENTLSEWFETIAEIEMRRGNMPYLIDRSLYPDGDIDWNQGLKRSDIESWMSDSPYGIGEYPFMNPIKPSVEPLSGYFNRILTVKYVLRMMATLTLSSDSFDSKEGWDETTDETVKLSDLREKSWKTASYAKDTLLLMDKLLESKGIEGPKISVGFPNKDTKSKERFVSQFVGSRRKNELSGALFEMGFASVRSFMGMSTEEVWFTTFGWHFALMENPVLDQTEGWEKGNRFSDDEVKFLLEHFRRNVPAEWDFILSIADMIRNGFNESLTINGHLIEKRGWNANKASVYRTGVMGRMQEMGLIQRIKSGTKVEFVLTESGESLLKPTSD
tara:strand:- start:150 stop:1343 length:1194 start_codon:yes stop_codon:yes gene_type:complete